MSTKVSTTIGGVLLTLFFGFTILARDHSELNGTWTMLPAQIDFADQPAVQTGTVTIADRDGVIIISRNFKYDGATETTFYRDVTDAGHGETFHDGKDLKSKTSWDHDVLKVTTTQSRVVTVESYSLAADGSMTDSVVQPGHKPIVLVFHRN